MDFACFVILGSFAVRTKAGRAQAIRVKTQGPIAIVAGGSSTDATVHDRLPRSAHELERTSLELHRSGSMRLLLCEADCRVDPSAQLPLSSSDIRGRC